MINCKYLKVFGQKFVCFRWKLILIEFFALKIRFIEHVRTPKTFLSNHLLVLFRFVHKFDVRDLFVSLSYKENQLWFIYKVNINKL